MNRQSALNVGSYAVTALIAFLFGYLYHRAGGTWRSTGDGRTIVNSRTGELRVTAAGETVDKYRARAAAELAAQQEESRKYVADMEEKRRRGGWVNYDPVTEPKGTMTKEEFMGELKPGFPVGKPISVEEATK